MKTVFFRAWRRIFALLAFCSSWVVAVCAAPLSPRDVFDAARVHTIHIKVSAKAWDLLQPGAGAQKATTATNREQAKIAGVRLRPTAPASYAYVLGEMEFDGQRIPDVGLRFKGNSSYFVSGGTLRRPMKVDFDRFVDGKRFAGLESFNLSNTTFDPSQVRETIAFSLFQKMDVPAPRTGHALVYLTVTGKHDREYIGLYTIIEEVDQRFLKSNYGNADGLLLKPGGMRGFANLGETWDQYKYICSPRTEERPDACQKIIEFAKLINRADDASFRAKVRSLLAVDEFLRFVAVNSAIVNYDSFLSTGHNYYVYVNPADGRIHFIPWDVNMSFGGYGWLGADDEIVQTSITRCYADHNNLIERLLAIPEYASAYRAHLQKLVSLGFGPERIREQRESLRPILAIADKAERATGRTNNSITRSVTGLGLNAPELWSFFERRTESIKLQLEGKQAGFKPEFRNPKRVRSEWSPFTVAAVTFVDAVDTDGDRRTSDQEVMAGIKRLLAAANLPANGLLDRTNAAAVLDKVMTEDLRRRVPAKAWVDWIFASADANKDDRVSAEEMFAAYHRFQTGSDADRDGRMDGRDLLESMSGNNAPRDPDPGR